MATEWLTDDKGNRCSVEYFGTKEAAQSALDSLINCEKCTNCSGCSRCSRCSGCSRCSRCSGCSGCSDCSRCSGCSDCSRCSDCSDCSDCSGCSGCSDCSGCSGCSDCSHIALLNGKEKLVADPSSSGGFIGSPPVPAIADIHNRVYEAVSKPTALDMSSWHTCDTTHCRAGWVVHLAGEAGYALERFHNTLQAARMIYDASDPNYRINPCRFFDSNEAALADMKALAKA